MITSFKYARKSKQKHENRKWTGMSVTDSKNIYITGADWAVFDFCINGVIYTNPTEEVTTLIEKHNMWSELKS
jgi:hypothetical protein